MAQSIICAVNIMNPSQNWKEGAHVSCRTTAENKVSRWIVEWIYNWHTFIVPLTAQFYEVIQKIVLCKDSFFYFYF